MNLFDQLVAGTLPFVPRTLVRYVSSKYIAGEQLSDAIRCIKDLNAQGYSATLDVLGEFITTLDQAKANAAKYIDTIHAIAHHQVNATVSVKPTSMGLLIDPEACYQNMHRIVSTAAQYDMFVRIDMEDVTCTDLEFDLLYRLRQTFSNVGIVVQAYLKRTSADMDRLIQEQINLRICKGIYIEEPVHLIENANTNRLAINPYFLDYTKRMLEASVFVGIATHDEHVIEGALALIEQTGATPDQYEFQMLLGVREHLRDQLRDAGHPVRIYVPFGQDWYGYSIRRLNENPSIAGYVLKATLFGK